jgi:hypothetical protein
MTLNEMLLTFAPFSMVVFGGVVYLWLRAEGKRLDIEQGRRDH